MIPPTNRIAANRFAESEVDHGRRIIGIEFVRTAQVGQPFTLARWMVVDAQRASPDVWAIVGTIDCNCRGRGVNSFLPRHFTIRRQRVMHRLPLRAGYSTPGRYAAWIDGQCLGRKL